MSRFRIALLTLKDQIKTFKTCFTSRAGFTLVELLIVMALIAFLLALSVPFVQSLRPEIALQNTLREVKSEVVSTLTYALAGKSFATVTGEDTLDPALPAAYGLHFSMDPEVDYFEYLEFSSDDYASEKPMDVIFQHAIEYPSSAVSLEGITLVDEKNQTTPLQEVYLMVAPPFGKVLFLDQEGLLVSNVFEVTDSQKQDLQLTFRYKDYDQDLRTFSVTTDKRINIF